MDFMGFVLVQRPKPILLFFSSKKPKTIFSSISVPKHQVSIPFLSTFPL